MSQQSGRHSLDWYVSYCDCGCGTVRFHTESPDGFPPVTLVFTAERAVEVAEELRKGARNAGFDPAAHPTPSQPTAH